MCAGEFWDLHEFLAPYIVKGYRGSTTLEMEWFALNCFVTTNEIILTYWKSGDFWIAICVKKKPGVYHFGTGSFQDLWYGMSLAQAPKGQK